MVNEKERIIRKLGIPCTIQYKDGDELSSKCLIKRASAVFNSMLSLESHRRGDFIYTDNITGGCIITNDISGEKFIAVATYPEVFKTSVFATVSHMLVCNSLLTVTRDVRSADVNGNISRSNEVIVSDLDMCVEVVDQDIKQIQPGLHSETELLIFAPTFEANLLDNVIIKNGGNDLNVKIISYNYISYKGIILIEAKKDSR